MPIFSTAPSRQISTPSTPRRPELNDNVVSGRNLEAVNHFNLDWLDWYNNRDLLKPIGNAPPAKAETRYYTAQQEIGVVA